MGSLRTTVIGRDGRSNKINAGDDSLATYRIGDEVRWIIDPDRPGEGVLLDDVYDAWDAFVVIKDHRIAAVRPFEGDSYDADNVDIEAGLRSFYGVEPPPREWWTPEAWAAKEVRDAATRAKVAAEYERNRCRKKHQHTLTCELKAHYPSDRIERLVYEDHPFLKLLPKSTFGTLVPK